MDWGAEQEPLLRLLRSAAEQGTGRNAALILPTFGKTGTTQEHRDAWFIGFAGDLIVGVWVGNDDEAPMRAVAGGSAPVQIWRTFMQTAAREEIAAYEAFLEQAAAQQRLADAQADTDAHPKGWLERLAEVFGL